MAPEIIQGKAYDEASDIWSLGIVAYELAEGQLPYACLSVPDTLVAIVREKPPRLPTERWWSADFQDFIRRCLRKVPGERASANDLLNHAFVGYASSVGSSGLTDFLSQTCNESNVR